MSWALPRSVVRKTVDRRSDRKTRYNELSNVGSGIDFRLFDPRSEVEAWCWPSTLPVDHQKPMSSNTYWLKLRSWNGSQQDAFEELCCQLAHTENVPERRMFRRKGTPDAGLECYWIRADGSEWGWQAKFFIDGLTGERLKQCDSSVRRALEGHPGLTKLHFCIPHDLADPRNPERDSAEARWQSQKRKWEKWAATAGRHLDIVLWGSHELTSRLSLNEHKGREWFWFNAPAMDFGWFRKNIAAVASQAEASDRYTSDFNVEVPVAEKFEALSRTRRFSERMNGHSCRLSEALADLRHYEKTFEIELVAQFTAALASLLTEMNGLCADISGTLELSGVRGAISTARTALEAVNMNVRRSRRETEKMATVRDELFFFRVGDFDALLEEIDEFCDSTDTRLAILPCMLLAGGPGKGKTQLLCTVAERRGRAGLPTILVLGEHFESGDPWRTITGVQGLSADRDTFLGALNAAGESAGCRALILIDAINEGPGITYWNKHLVTLISHVRCYPYVSLAISIRDAYEKFLHGIEGKTWIRVRQSGFEGISGSATREFFTRYGLAEPNIPMLSPEFENPLLLKLLCRALADDGGHVTDDTFGVTSVFDLVLTHINKRLSDETLLDFDESEQVVQKAVRRIAAVLAGQGNEVLGLDEAKLILEDVYPSRGNSKSLLKHLVAEHVIVRLPRIDKRGRLVESVRFAYQRLSDHLIVTEILERCSPADVPALFRKNGVFGKSMAGGWLYEIAGWLEALAIQLPERFGVELDQATGISFQHQVLLGAFVKSLVWRNVRSFPPETVSRVAEMVAGNSHLGPAILDELMTVTAKPGHPLNADWLDRWLHPLDMADRDSLWSVFLFGQVKNQGGVFRLIEWAWSERSQEHFSDEIVRLAGLTLVWCLTASDRFVRDRATKALVSLLSPRIHVLRNLIRHFADVDEPYLQERLMAVGFGCSMLTESTDGVARLAQETYDSVFRHGEPPASVLLRDHARGIIDCAVRRGCKVDFEAARIIPPYRSSWFEDEPPDLEALGKLYQTLNFDPKYFSLRRIYHSVTGDDFSHYIIKDVTKWSRFPSSFQRDILPRIRLQKIKGSLSPEIAEILGKYAEACRFMEGRWDSELHQSFAKDRIDYIGEVENALAEILGGEKKAADFTRDIVPYLKNRSDERFVEYFSIELFQRLILSRVLELGWTVERFGSFDHEAFEAGRKARKAERIGKKYQWIAYDELHARISDNFGIDDSDRLGISQYDWAEGLWPLEFRDIDPSLLLKATPRDGWAVNSQNSWTPHHYQAWKCAPTSQEWLRSERDLPSPEDFLVLGGGDGERWFCLQSSPRWKREQATGEHEGMRRGNQEIHYAFQSYLVRLEHLPEMLDWAGKQDWSEDRLPQPRDQYKQYLHEHYWSPHHDGNLDDEWVCAVWHENDLPHPVVVTTGGYTGESSTYDCSLDSSVCINVPSRWLSERMELKMRGRNGSFFDSSGQLAAFDPSTSETGEGAFVMRADLLSDFLQREGLAIFWTFLGEKNIYPPEGTTHWPGRLTMQGVYHSQGYGIGGSFRTEFTEGRD